MPLPAQRVQVSHFKMRAAVTVAPGVAFAIDPGHLHAGGQGADAVQVCIVAYMQHLLRRHTGNTGGGFKNAHIGLGHARLAGAHAGVKVLADPHTVHIGIAIGQGHDRQARAPESQRGQGVVKQVHPLPLGEKHLESRFGQLACLARRLQQGTNGLTP